MCTVVIACASARAHVHKQPHQLPAKLYQKQRLAVDSSFDKPRQAEAEEDVEDVAALSKKQNETKRKK